MLLPVLFLWFDIIRSLFQIGGRVSCDVVAFFFDGARLVVFGLGDAGIRLVIIGVHKDGFLIPFLGARRVFHFFAHQSCIVARFFVFRIGGGLLGHHLQGFGKFFHLHVHVQFITRKLLIGRELFHHFLRHLQGFIRVIQFVAIEAVLLNVGVRTLAACLNIAVNVLQRFLIFIRLRTHVNPGVHQLRSVVGQQRNCFLHFGKGGFIELLFLLRIRFVFLIGGNRFIDIALCQISLHLSNSQRKSCSVADERRRLVVERMTFFKCFLRRLKSIGSQIVRFGVFGGVDGRVDHSFQIPRFGGVFGGFSFLIGHKILTSHRGVYNGFCFA